MNWLPYFYKVFFSSTLLNVQVMMKKKMVENESSGDVRAAFKVFDQDGDGWVSFSLSLFTKMMMSERRFGAELQKWISSINLFTFTAYKYFSSSSFHILKSGFKICHVLCVQLHIWWGAEGCNAHTWWGNVNHHNTKGSPTPKKRVYLGIAQIAIWPPLLRKSGHFVAQMFCRKWENS